MLPVLRLLSAAAVLLALAGCESVRGWVPTFVQPYRPDVQQGNVVTKEMVEQLRPGMTRDQVRFLLGTPMLASLFHQDRWDYVYYLKRGKGTETQQRKLVVHFKDNRLERFDSDAMPTETAADNLILGRKGREDRPPPPPTRSDVGSQLPPAPTRE